MSQKNNINGLFVPIHKATLESPAWKALSLGARCLFVELSGECSNKHNVTFLSEREAIKRLRSSRYKIREFFAELAHYKFIDLVSPACLGTDGKGKAAHWRITDRGTVKGGYEAPGHDFLRWAGTKFDPKPYRAARNKWDRWQLDKIKKQNPGTDGVTRVQVTGLPGLDMTGLPGNAQGAGDGVTIEQGGHAGDGVTITRLTTTRLGKPLSDGLEGEQTIIAPNDPRLETSYLKKRSA
jgi:hypothetical protein